MRTVFRVILIINHRAGRGAAAARGGGAARRRAARSGAARPSVLNGPASWSLMQRNGRAALDSRGCLPPVAAQAGGGGRPPVPRGTGAGPSLPGLRSRAVVVPSSLQNDHAAIVAGARHVPGGRTVLVESVCRQGGTTRGQCRRDAARRAWLRSAAGTRRRGLAFDKSGTALPATFSLTRAHRRAWGGRAAAARLTLS